MKEFTSEELAQFDGENGKPVYIAHEGKVYDVSASKMWKTGTHMKRHHSGQDLTTDIQGAPHTPEVFQRFSQVGMLQAEKETEDPRVPAPLAALLRIFPFFRRHPHPMTVHFPIVFMFSTRCSVCCISSPARNPSTPPRFTAWGRESSSTGSRSPRAFTRGG